MTHLITSRTDWTPKLLEEIWLHIEDVGINDLKYDINPNEFRICSAEQMLDAYASIGLPVNYNHWSFGKEYIKNATAYNKGQRNLAYEMVINSNPTINYLMEENDAVTQALVMAHAGIGHNFVFKNNYMFKEWTNPGSILDYMVFARDYIISCEEKYGVDEVEFLLDAAHALASHGVDKRKKKHKKKLSSEEVIAKSVADEDEQQQYLDHILQITSLNEPEETSKIDEDTGEVDEENILYFIYKNSPNLKEWQREILRICYKVNTYYYPQKQDSTVHEGCATFTHFYIMSELENRGLISPDAQLSWLAMHAGVVFQPELGSKYYQGESFNPYALGFDLLKEIRRICERPTKEDEEWFPWLAGKDWRTEIKTAVTDFRDESLIEQYMSPSLMRKYKMMTVGVYDDIGIVEEISDDKGYAEMRRTLSSHYALVHRIPEISVKCAKMKGDRKLILEYRPYLDRSLHSANAKKVLSYVRHLWGYEVEIGMTTKDGKWKTLFTA